MNISAFIFTQYFDDISDDSVRLHLREIGKIPLLSAEEELALAQRVVAGEKRAKDKMAEAKADAYSQKSLYLMEGAVATQRVSSAGAEETRGNVLQTVSLQ